MHAHPRASSETRVGWRFAGRERALSIDSGTRHLSCRVDTKTQGWIFTGLDAQEAAPSSCPKETHSTLTRGDATDFSPPHLLPAPMLSHELSSGGDRIDQCAFRDPFRRIRSRIARRDGDVRAFARVQSQARAGRGRAGRPGGARGIRTRRGRVQEGGTDRSTNRCAWKDVQETRAGSRT